MRSSSLALSAALALLATSTRVRTAHADDVALDVTTLEGALDLNGVLQRSGAHGCSQSFASSSDHGALHLTVDARGAATLAVDIQSHQTFGPSPGRYAEGERDITNTTELAHADYFGTATLSAGALVVRFARASRSSIRIRGYGTLPLPAPTVEPLAVVMTCRVTRADVLPAEVREGERPTPIAVAECAFDTVPVPMDRFATASTSLARGHGVAVSYDSPMWDYEVTRTVRRAP